MPDETLENIGEKELIKRISKFMPKNQTSDDCAYLEIPKKNVLINTDMMVENIHFSNQTIAPFDVGWKAVICNFSDLLSSGCNNILGVNIGLVVTAETEWEWVQQLYKGIETALNQFGGKILGGDCSKGAQKMIAITALGTQGGIQLRRYACKPGQIILTTGIHGLSCLGLALKQKTIFAEDLNLTQKIINHSIEAFCHPELDFKILDQVENTYEFTDNKLVGGTDTSDGLYQAVLDLSLESKCKAVIDYKSFPIHEDWQNGDLWDKFYLFGGEDYKLILSLPRRWADKVMELNESIKEIGYFTEGKPAVEIKNYEKKISNLGNSFSHF